MSETIIDLIRHGEPLGGSRFRGNRIDDSLSETGWQQMKSAIALADQWDVVISSPLVRCRAFAEMLSAERGIPMQVVEDFKEVGFGDWEGLTKDYLQKHRADEYLAFYENPTQNRPPGAESLEDFTRRVSRALDQVLTSYAGQRVLIVAHAGVLRACMAHVVKAPPYAMYNIKVSYAGRVRIVTKDGLPLLESLVGTPVLES